MRTTDNITTNREIKSDMFCMLFSKKARALELYNALHGTAYTNLDDLEITTLKDVIYMKVKNDVSFLINKTMSLYEHQSTINPNMPIRGLLYLADLYRHYLRGKNPYGSKLIMLPTPEYVVFYNGIKDAPESKYLKLSDSFEHGNEQSHMELWAQMININTGHNKELMDKCSSLREYSFFMGRIRANQESMSFEDAVNTAIDDCIAAGVLSEFLKDRRLDIVNSFLTEYDEELALAEQYEDGKSDGLAEGRELERAAGIHALVRSLTNLNIPKDSILEQLIAQYHLSKDEARKYL